MNLPNSNLVEAEDRRNLMNRTHCHWGTSLARLRLCNRCRGWFIRLDRLRTFTFRNRFNKRRRRRRWRRRRLISDLREEQFQLTRLEWIKLISRVERMRSEETGFWRVESKMTQQWYALIRFYNYWHCRNNRWQQLSVESFACLIARGQQSSYLQIISKKSARSVPRWMRPFVLFLLCTNRNKVEPHPIFGVSSIVGIVRLFICRRPCCCSLDSFPSSSVQIVGYVLIKCAPCTVRVMHALHTDSLTY